MTPSETGKALAALRSPKNMKRGDSKYYSRLAKLPRKPKRPKK